MNNSKRNITTTFAFALAVTACGGGARLLWESINTHPSSQAQYATDIAIDNQGNRIISGARQTYSASNSTGDSIIGFDPYIAMYDETGLLKWEAILPTSHERDHKRNLVGQYDPSFLNYAKDYNGGEEVVDIVVAADAIYALAHVLGSTYNDKTGYYQRSDIDWDVALYKLSSTGELLWQKAVEVTDGRENPKELATLPDGQVVVLMERTFGTDSDINVLLASYDSSGNQTWLYETQGTGSAIGVGDSSLLLAYNKNSAEIPSATEFSFNGAINWQYSDQQSDQNTGSAYQPACSGGGIIGANVTAHDVAYDNGEWLVASSEGRYFFFCATQHFNGLDNIDRFDGTGQHLKRITLKPALSESKIQRQAELMIDQVEASDIPEFFDIRSTGMEISMADSGYYVTSNLARITFFRKPDGYFPANHPRFMKNIHVHKLSSNDDVEWREVIRTSPEKTENSQILATHQLAGVSLMESSTLLVASHVLKAEYMDTTDDFEQPVITDFYSRVHEFNASGSRAILNTNAGDVTRGIATFDGQYSLVNDDFAALGFNNQTLNSLPTLDQYIDLSIGQEAPGNAAIYIRSYQ